MLYKFGFVWLCRPQTKKTRPREREREGFQFSAVCKCMNWNYASFNNARESCCCRNNEHERVTRWQKWNRNKRTERKESGSGGSDDDVITKESRERRWSEEGKIKEKKTPANYTVRNKREEKCLNLRRAPYISKSFPTEFGALSLSVSRQLHHPFEPSTATEATAAAAQESSTITKYFSMPLNGAHNESQSWECSISSRK